MDKRLIHLKVKIKSLEAESKIIKHEEIKTLTYERFKYKSENPDWTGYAPAYNSLYRHRKDIVGQEARHSLLAYGFLRGLSYKNMEPSCKNLPRFSKVKKLAEQFYHTRLYRDSKYEAQIKLCKEFDEKWNAWLTEAKAS